MSTQVQHRRGTDAQHEAFTGAMSEITHDTTNNNLRVHDGSKPGGYRTLMEHERGVAGGLATLDETGAVPESQLRNAQSSVFESKANVESAQINPNIHAIRTSGYASPGDGGGALYKRVPAEPDHSAKIQSADGAWWGLVRQTWPFEVFGAVGDGATVNDTAYNVALGFYGDFGEVTLIEGRQYLLSGNLPNPSGVVFRGKGRLRYGGNVVQSYADRLPLHIGGEYLAAFASKQFGATIGIALFGDSTVAHGNGETGASIQDIIRYELESRGIKSAVNVQNYAVGGTKVPDMDAIGKIGINSNALFVIKYGINDGGNPVETRLNTFRTALRGKLAEIRQASGGGVDDLSILLVSPTAAFDDPSGKNENWMEQLREVYVQAARDYKCAFFDAYAFAKDNRAGGGFNAWMVDDLHPNWASYEPLWCSITGFIASHSLVAHNRTVNGVYSIPNARRSIAGAVTPANLPADFPYGVSIYRSLPTDGWPFDGAVVTIKHTDGACIQSVYPYAPSGHPACISRVSGSSESSWSAWTGINYAPTMANGWGIYPGFAGMAYRHDGQGGVHLSGVSSAGATSTGTVICTVPAQFAPAETRIFAAACGGASGFCNVAVDNTGAIKVHDVEPSGWVSLDITWPVK